MGAFLNLKGQRFGKLIVIGLAPKKEIKIRWVVKCDCGCFSLPYSFCLISGNTKSCGCMVGGVKHRHARTGYESRTYRSWSSARNRCQNKNNPSFQNYGGRGIKFCERWNNFQLFLKDMGQRPEGMMIDRINNNGNYEPDNCRWVTIKESNKNRRPLKDPGGWKTRRANMQKQKETMRYIYIYI